MRVIRGVGVASITASLSGLRTTTDVVLAAFTCFDDLYAKFFESTLNVVPCKRILVGEDKGVASADFLLLVEDSKRIRAFECNYESVIGVGRWHRQPSGSSAILELSRVQAPAIGFGLTGEAISKFCAAHVNAVSNHAIGIKSLMRRQVDFGHVQGFFLPQCISFTKFRPKLQTLHKDIKVLIHHGNVISRLETRKPIDLSLAKGDGLFIRTSKGKIAHVIAGDPAQGSLLLSPETFTLDPDDLIIDLVQPLPSKSFECVPGLTLTLETPSNPKLALRSAIIQLDQESVYFSDPEFLADFDSLSIKETQ